MSLDQLLDVTEQVTIQFMNHEIVAHVYTVGAQRLTKEEREKLSAVEEMKPPDDSANLSDDERKSRSNQAYSASVDSVRTVLPIICKGVDLDGEPLVYKEKAFPDNVPLFPDSLLIAIGDAALKKWNAANPTSGEQSPAGEQQTETQEQSQVATSTL